MTRVNLNLDQKDLWRFQLEKALMKPLMKKPTASVKYNIQKKMWEINGRFVSCNDSKISSSCTANLQYVFHKIGLCFSKSYQRKFNDARMKLMNAQLIAQKEISHNEQSVSSRKQGLITTVSAAEKAKAKTLELQKAIDQKRINDFENYRMTHLALKSRLEKQKAVIETLERMLLVFTTSRKALEKIVREMKIFPSFRKVDFLALSENEVQDILLVQQKKLKPLQKELEDLTHNRTQSQVIFQDQAHLYALKAEQLGNQCKVIYNSSLVPPPNKKLPSQVSVPNLEITPISPLSLNDHTEAFLNAIHKYIGRDLEQLWRKLLMKFLNKYQEDFLSSCFEVEPHVFEFNFKAPLRIWVPLKTLEGVEEPPGGVVLMLGHNGYSNEPQNFKMRLDFKIPNTMTFDYGAELFAKTPEWAYTWSFGLIPEKVLTKAVFFNLSNDICSLKVKYGVVDLTSKNTSKNLLNQMLLGEVLDSQDDPYTIIKSHLK